MTTRLFKRIPYGKSNFRDIILNGYAYIDKTRFIEELENEDNPNHFFIRPRKFGKSMFLTTLRNYYDVNTKDEFEQIFGNLYIGKHPTPERNSYAIMEFDFSGLNTASEEKFAKSFSKAVQSAVSKFLRKYEHIIPKAGDFLQQIFGKEPEVDVLTDAFNLAFNGGIKIYIIIDEYDHFANDLIAMGTLAGKDFYKTMVSANGMVRDFYERIKAATKDDTVFRTFITGISPVMLDDLTSGYNIAEILTLNPKYNEMLGFTQTEVETLMVETGVDPALINVDMEAYYNGYKFHPEGENRVYNPSMILYFFGQILMYRKPPKNIIDPNLHTDYGRLQRLAKNDRNRETLLQIIRDGSIVSEILEKFPIDMIDDDSYFISLLFYMGMLTVDEQYRFQLKLRIPNYSIKVQYWEYLAKYVLTTSPDITVESRPLQDAIYELAMKGDVQGFISYISENAFSKLSDHDLQRFDEKYIQVLMLAYLFMSNIYIPMSEYEAVPGRADIFLQRNPLYPEIRCEWVFEIKYCKTSARDSEIAEKRSEGLEQLQQYLQSYRIKDRPGLKGVLLFFTGKNKFEITEIK
ncbi:MAG: ATP-binding protein [Prevotellaceae bacterium]|nr:ATP-binding protein [Prevotellaceae bacterium]